MKASTPVTSAYSSLPYAASAGALNSASASSLPAPIPTGPRVGGLGPPRQTVNPGGGNKQTSSTWAKPYDRPSPEIRDGFGRENELFPNHARYDGSAQDNLSINGSVNEDNSHSSNIQTRPNNDRPIELFPDRQETVTKKRHPSLGRRQPKAQSPAPEESDIESDSDSADELGDTYFEENIAKLQESIRGEKERNPLLPRQTPVVASDWHSFIVPIVDNTADETCEAPITHQESKSEQLKEVSPPIPAPVPVSKAESPLATSIPAEIPTKELDVVTESAPRVPTPTPAPIGQLPDEVERSLVEELPVKKETSPVEKSPAEITSTENIPIEGNNTQDVPVEETPIEEPSVEKTPSEKVPAEKIEVSQTEPEVPITSVASDTNDTEMVDEVAQQPTAIQAVIESAIRDRSSEANNEPAREPPAASEPKDVPISPKTNGVHLPSGPAIDHEENTEPAPSTSAPIDKVQDVEMPNGHSAMDLDAAEEQLPYQPTTNGTKISPRIDRFEESEGSITAREREEELEAVRRMMKTPPLSSLPKSKVTCFWDNPDLVAELEIRNFKVEAEVRKYVQEKKARRKMEEESEGKAWAKRYYEYRKFTDFSMDPAAVRSREKFSASRARAEAEAAAPLSSIASANSKPEGRRTGRWATEHDFERVLRESELEAKEKKDQDERLARAKTASAKEATIPVMMDGQWWLENGFADKSHLVPFNRSFALLEYGEPVDNFTPEESEIFEKVYLENPKNWSNVADALSNRDFKACIQHYYLVKHSSKLKDKSKGGKGKGKGKGGRKPTRPKTTVLSARLGNGDDAEETPDNENGERKGRPRRAAAPVFPIDTTPNDTEAGTPAPTPGRKANATLKTEPGSESGPAKKKVKVTREKGSKQGKNNQLLAAAPIASADRRDGSPATPVPEPKSSRGSTGPNRFPIQFDGPTQPQSIQPQPAVVPQFVPGGRPANVEPFAEFGPQNKPPPTLQSMPPQQSQPPPKAPATSQPQPYPSQDRVNSTTPLSFDAQQDRRSVQQTSSYWSVPEQTDFAQLLEYYGTDWQAIAKYMTTKTHIMVYTDLFQQWLAVPSDSNKSRRVANIQAQVKNYYQRQVDSGRRHWETITREADARKERGETLPPLPSPTIIPKRRYDERSGTLPGPSSHPSRTGSALDGMEDMASPGPSSMLPRSSQASPSQPGPSLSARFPALANAGPVPHIQPATPASIISKQVTPQPAQQTPPVPQNIRPRGPSLGYFVTETQQRPPLHAASSDSNLSQRSLQVAQEAHIERQSALRLEKEQREQQKQREQEQRRELQQLREQQLYQQQRQELEEKKQVELLQQQRQREELERPREQQSREQQERDLQMYQQQQQHRQEFEQTGRQRELQKQQQREEQRREREQDIERERAIAIDRERQETHNYHMKLKKENTNEHPSLQGYEPYSTTSMRNSNVIAHSRADVPQQIPERREQYQPVRNQQTPRTFGNDKPPTGPREIREREMKPSPSPALPRLPPTGPSMRNEPMRNEAMRNDMYSTPPAQPKPPTQPQHHHQPPLQAPQASAVRQQETVRKTSNIMSLLNDDEPSDPRPELPKRVSNVVSTPQPSHTPPPQHPLQANRFASHQPPSQPPPQMQQQVPTQPASHHSQHNSQHHISHSPHPYSHASPHPMHQHTSSIGQNRSYTPTNLDRRGYEPPPAQHTPQHTPQQTPLFSQPPSRQSIPSQPTVRRELSHGDLHGLAGGYSRGGPAQSAMRLKESPYSSTPPPAATQSVRPPATSPHDLAQPSERDYYARQPSQAQYIMQQQQQQPASASPQLAPSYQPQSQQPPSHRQFVYGQSDSHMASPPFRFGQHQQIQRSRHNSLDARSYGPGSVSSGSTPSHSGYPPQAPHQPAHPMQYQHPARQGYSESNLERDMQMREQERRLREEEQAQAQYHQRLRDDRDRR